MKKIGIVILNYMSWELTIKLLSNLNDLKDSSFFVVVVDNASSNDSFDKISNEIKSMELKYKIYLKKAEKNGGYSSGNNIGIQIAQNKGADFIWIANNDILIKDYDILNEIREKFKSDNKLAMIGTKILNPDGSFSYPYKKFSLNRFLLNYYLFPITKLLRISSNKYDGLLEERYVYSVCGASFFIKSSVMKEIDNFDENVFLFSEELILGEKLKNKDYKVLYFPKIEILHMHSKTISNYFNKKKKMELNLQSRYYFMQKYLVTNKTEMIFLKLGILLEKFIWINLKIKLTEKGN